MKVVAQSQPAAQVSYIHLAYLSAQLENRISKGDLLPMQASLGVAVATAIACGAVGAKLAQPGRRGRATKIGAALGFFATLGVLWLVQAAWSESRSSEAVVKHVIQTRQYWALRDKTIAAGIEAAALTNGTAAVMAADYYALKGAGRTETPDLEVKAYRYGELAAAQGQASHWVRVAELTNNPEYLRDKFEVALQKGKLSEAEQTWTRQHLARMAERADEQDQGKVRH